MIKIGIGWQLTLVYINAPWNRYEIMFKIGYQY